jgi:hypothetical protein
MRSLRIAHAGLILGLLAAGTWLPVSAAGAENEARTGRLKLGWASADITPDRPVVITGGSAARVSEGVSDHIFATALAVESTRDNGPSEMVILVSLDLVGVTDILCSRVQDLVRKATPAVAADKIILNATHTHTAPDQGTAPDLEKMHSQYGIKVPVAWAKWGIDLGVMSAEEYVEFAAARIAGAISQAWKARKPGGISFGLSYATTGRNRLVAYYNGTSEMYGTANRPDFSHVEGYEDHSLGLLYTWDVKGNLTGVVINIAMPSQVAYGSRISADFWHATRKELRRRLGEELYILPQVSAAGDQSPKLMVDERAEKRMEKLTGRTQMEQIGIRISDGVTSILPFMKESIDRSPVLKHRVEQVELNRRVITEKDLTTRRSTFHNKKAESVRETLDRLLVEYKNMYKQFEEHPELKRKPRWYVSITATHWLLARAWRTLERYELQKTVTTVPVEVHVIRIGDVAIATNPFELYLDYGMQMKARSKAVQTFVVELASPGGAGYLPTQRSVQGGAYGAIPQSTLIGPEGGRVLVNRTLELIEPLWDDK